MSSHLSATECRRRGCEHLETVIIETVKGPRRNSFCNVTGKVPGNMSTCPLEGKQ
ncbi:hypothetical protein [Methanolobus psychrotolerans]|uniref:hypothetical protein n=1 Tax=Methanolobus psychrotolerans TaxID=1874706 RepID=UPI0013ECCD44|nr:hypothetical protein [Methanolobus psychrotolerans]